MPQKRKANNWVIYFSILLVLGIVFRGINLDKKVYWYDETFTSLRVAGYTEAEAVENLSQNRLLSVEELLKYQTLNPEKSVVDTIKSLATEDTQHPPLYYGLARFWMQQFGSSVTAMRSFAAVLSLLAFPCIYWLCMELFQSSLTGWVAVSLIAVSPFHLGYAQQSRQYGFWAVTILFSCAALLRALRVKTKLSWGIYAVALAASLYTFLFSGLVAISHGIYVLFREKFRRISPIITAYIGASIAGFLIFVPWIIVVIVNFFQAKTVISWTALKGNFIGLLKAWVGNLGRVFCETQNEMIDRLASLGVLILVIYALYFLWRYAPGPARLFVFLLIGLPAASLILPDLITGGLRSTAARYLIPSYLGIELAVAYLIGNNLKKFLNGSKANISGSILISLLLFTGGFVSCGISLQAEAWWHNQGNPVVARAINRAANPIVISDTHIADILSLSHLLDSKVRLLIEPRCYTCSINSNSETGLYFPKVRGIFSDVFLFSTSASELWIQELKKQNSDRIELVLKSYESSLWRLKQ